MSEYKLVVELHDQTSFVVNVTGSDEILSIVYAMRDGLVAEGYSARIDRRTQEWQTLP